jgi:hypothetical protein
MGSIALDLAAALDPVRMLADCGLTPDPWQAALLRSDARRMLLLCSRQSGKSTVSAAMALHEALYRPPALVLLLSPSLRQSKELFGKVMSFFRALGRPVPVVRDSTLELELRNGSRIVALPGEERTIRGYSGTRLLVIDEASRVEDALYASVRPMLAVSGGRLVALSTPFGRRGWFWEAWEGPEPWERVRITAEQCPRITAEFLEEERRSVGEWWLRQEYFCEFVDTADSFFAYEHIAAALSEEVEPFDWEAL